MTNHCGSCTACCKVFAIPELEKPAGTWCTHCDIGKGCKVYDTRPAMCRDYECLWLQSQKRGVGDTLLGPELRPDRCKVVFSPSTNDKVMSAMTMPGAPLAWQRPVVRALISRMVSHGIAVVVGQPAATEKTMISSDGIKPVRMTPPDETGMQWNIED